MARVRYDFESIVRLTELADYSIAFTIRIVADLGIADLLTTEPRTVDELAAATETHAPSLHRALRALASKGIFDEVEPGRFGLSPLAELLRSDHPLSMRSGLCLVKADVAAWAEFEYTIRTGKPAFDHVHGIDFWDYLSKHPSESALFMRSQQPMTRLELRGVLRTYDWTTFESIVDLGGGDGTFLAGLLQNATETRGTLFDLPNATRLAPGVFDAAGVRERCEIVSGSYFDSVPNGHDGYVLKRVLWGHDDEEARRILTNVRRGIPDHGRVVVVEPLRTEGAGYDVAKLLDLKLLAMGGGCARSLRSFETLFAETGFKIDRVVPAVLTSVIEARPA